ncbi:hypothetical protein BpHYR1_018878 [Brachionus plicatilis]|uniref:Uncharacterized protein n=1 Tax=Brachionus plicatilis TaxID=10195 RepID=A0A3M7PRU5_BRAPC|nr:hypothetical protein BpHYR1_018878 [Brachionus plicatilis]
MLFLFNLSLILIRRLDTILKKFFKLIDRKQNLKKKRVLKLFIYHLNGLDIVSTVFSELVFIFYIDVHFVNQTFSLINQKKKEQNPKKKAHLTF